MTTEKRKIEEKKGRVTVKVKRISKNRIRVKTETRIRRKGKIRESKAIITTKVAKI
jgi:hypothetical protein